ncbi:MAG: FAD-binding oxidoreductase [Alphaproteobacteria bacterium]
MTKAQIAWINTADTFFIASGYCDRGKNAAYGRDASHRGGERSFVQVVGDGCLVFPDYAGNNHYNTIGNLVLDARVGLLFVDFETGSLLQLTGIASIDWDTAAVARVPGARRLVTVQIEQIVELPCALPLRWDTDADDVRSMRLIEKILESAGVTSFVFEARDGSPLPEFEAGQHLPIELEVPEYSEPVRRTYSLSGGPSQARYRISVKREPRGTASRFLHDHMETGTIISSRQPAGGFMLSCSTCPVVLVSAGANLTPMVGMLHVLAAERGGRPVWFVHGARDGANYPLAREVRELCQARSGIALHVAYSRPRREDTMSTDFDGTGRVDGALPASLIKNPSVHNFLCGPTRFMANLQTGLEGRGIPVAQIHTETFGPAG